MPATGGGRAVHSSAGSKRAEKSKSTQSTSSATVLPTRPEMKTRALSAPQVPKHDAEVDEVDRDAITDDTFFTRYHFPQDVVPTPEEPSDHSLDSSSDTEGPLSPGSMHTKYRQPAGQVPSEPSTGSANSDSAPPLQHVNIAVIGAPGTGKSTFIRRTLSLPDSTTPPNCTRKWTIDGVPYMVRFLEMLLDDVHFGERNFVKFPDTVHGISVPRMDGVVTMYDVTNQTSLNNVPDMLNVLAKAHIPLILVASKCDQHPALREVDPITVETKANPLLEISACSKRPSRRSRRTGNAYQSSHAPP